MEITQMLVFVVIAVELILVLISLYMYSSYKLRIFLFLSFGFIALLVASAVQVAISGNTTALSSVLDIAAGLFFLTGVLTAV
jgi:hypothetical protein